MDTKPIRITTALLTAAVSVFATVPGVHAQAFPSKPITLMIPYPPGGSADMLARPMQPELQKRLGHPIVLDYKPGAGGTIATAQLARAKPDGYTVLMVLAAHAINATLYPKLPYDTRSDFTAISLLANLPLLVAAPLSTPATIPELIKHAKANPGKLTFASAGPGNTSHLAGELFKVTVGIDMTHVPYKGSGPAVVALLGGEVSLMFDSISTSLPHVQSGKLRALAVTDKARSPLLPQTPTVAESVPGFVVNGWYGIIAPAKTPADVVRTLNRNFADVVKQPKIRDDLAEMGYTAVGSTPEEFAAHINAEIMRWAPIVAKSGAKVE